MTTKPNKRVIKRWVEALRSGKYKQGRKTLRKDDTGGNSRYCCLGVLCDLHSRTREGAKWDKSPLDYNDYEYDSKLGFLPLGVSLWAGLNSDDPVVEVGGERKSLSALNDRGVRFTTIANAIEREFLGGDK